MFAARKWPAACAALVVLVAAGLALTLTEHPLPTALPAHTAINDALRSREVKQALAGTRWTRASATALDGSLERVSFFAGSRIVAYVAVRANGTVDQVSGYKNVAAPWGDWLAYEPAVLATLAFLFALMLCVVPVRRVRNLDVLAALSLLPTIVLFQHRYSDAAAIAALAPLCYFLCRCAWRGAGHGTSPLPSTPLFDRLSRSWRPEDRVRLLRVILGAVGLVFAMVVVSSPGPVDVVFAVMEGATRLVHGVLPYGHMPGDVLHGDTYPILSYALYVPLASVSPVTSVFDSVDTALALAAAATLASAAVVAKSVVNRVRGDARQVAVPDSAGLRAAIGLLAFPSLLITGSTGTTDVVLGAMLLFALVLWHRPSASTAVLAAAAWFKLAPAALIPVWLAPRRGRALVRCCLAVLVVSAASLGLVIGLGGTGGVSALVHSVQYQFNRESVASPWIVMGVPWLQPLAEAAVLALIVFATVRLFREGPANLDRHRLAALSGAILLGLQLAAHDWSFLYLGWVLPLITLSLLADDVPATAPAVDRVELLERQLAAPALAVSR